MAAPPRPLPPMSVDEYLAFDERSPVRHEYVDGYVYAMTGGTLRHNRIAVNIASRLQAAARGGPCQVFIKDVRVRVSETRFYYPDLVVACGPLDMGATVLRDPCLIVEVTSASTRGTDQREKLVAYQQIPALDTYLIVAQDRRAVVRHFRVEGDRWDMQLLDGREGRDRLRLACPEAQLTLDEVYEGAGLA